MRHPLLIYGAGGLGREVVSLIHALDNFDIIGFLDDGIQKDTFVKGIKVLGGFDALRLLDHPVNLILALGDPVSKIKLAKKIGPSRVRYPVLIHPSVILQDKATTGIGEGCIICAGSIFTTDIKIGDHVLVNLNCTLGHDTSVGDYSSIMPGVNLAGGVDIGESVLIGSGANILNRIKVGNNSKIGMGSVVIRDVDPGITVAGVPAKRINS